MDPAQLYTLDRGDAAQFYPTWPTPRLILSDGAYGVGGFPGDPRTVEDLPRWYAPHVRAWSQSAGPGTTLWFWNTEVGWATVHPMLIAHGWRFEACHIWDKGVGQIAGNVNSTTIRRFPVVTEVCVMYSRPFTPTDAVGRPLPVNRWLRQQWQLAGFPLALTNEVCGVKSAATRKWFTLDHHWYWPPGSALEQLGRYANTHGRPEGLPYFSIDGQGSVTADQWDQLRYPWTHEHGVTNVWELPTLRSRERLKIPGGSAVHLNQKPLALMRRILQAASRPGDVVWEPFGGLCSASVAAVTLGRRPYAAEHDVRFADVAQTRLDAAVKSL